jgi:hypothetical protein
MKKLYTLSNKKWNGLLDCSIEKDKQRDYYVSFDRVSTNIRNMSAVW